MIQSGVLKRLSLVLALGVAASACETTGLSRGATNATSSSSRVSATNDGYVVTRIGRSSLESGSCGMVLWTLEKKQPTPVFRYTVNDTATIALNGREIELMQVYAAGSEAYGIGEAQRFQGVLSTGNKKAPDDAESVVAELTVQFGQNFENGVYLQDGLLTIDAPQGWRVVTPVAGIAGCRN